MQMGWFLARQARILDKDFSLREQVDDERQPIINST